MPIAIRRIDLIFRAEKNFEDAERKELPVERLQDLVDVREDERESDRLTLDLDETGEVWVRESIFRSSPYASVGVGPAGESQFSSTDVVVDRLQLFELGGGSSSCRKLRTVSFSRPPSPFLTIPFHTVGAERWTGSGRMEVTSP